MATTIDIDREAWLAERRKGIGASEGAAAMGQSPWQSPFQLWGEKTGLVEADDLSENEAVEFGIRFEPIVAESFAARTGRRVELWMPFKSIAHTEHPWLRCTPDAMQDALDEEREAFDWMADNGTLQIKTTSAFNHKEWSEGPPLHYQIQCQLELEVTGCQWGTLVVLIGGQKLRWFDFRRNQPFIDAAIPVLREFWHKVETETPPEVDGSAATARAIAKLYPGDNGDEVDLPAAAAEWDRELCAAKEAIKAAEARKLAAENKIKAAIGAATFGLLPDGSGYSYKTQERKGYVVDATTFRTLRRTK